VFLVLTVSTKNTDASGTANVCYFLRTLKNLSFPLKIFTQTTSKTSDIFFDVVAKTTRK